jgi:hypothetical protein
MCLPGVDSTAGLFEVGLINPTSTNCENVLLLDMRLSNIAYLLEVEWKGRDFGANLSHE